ncbi:MAG: EAL domain-containing protein [Planctomycetes bacterium]|nr:EAL domain-containing protein [Planctomycetota bacterium]
MSTSSVPWRVLVVDDNPDIHRDIEKCLAAPVRSGSLQALEQELFGAQSSPPRQPAYEFVHAEQGEQGVDACSEAVAKGARFSAAIVDMRMPPGIDGLETIERLWRVDPGLQVVLCTAFSDHSWKQITARLGRRDNLLVLRKPFEQIEVQQMMLALCEKRRIETEARARMAELECFVRERTRANHAPRPAEAARLDALDELVDRRTVELRNVALRDRVTRLPNRAHFAEAVNTALRRSERDAAHRFAVLYLVCDRYSVVCESLGAACGEELLLEVARRLSDACASDPRVLDACASVLPARLGGGEFVILLAGGVTTEGAVGAAQRIASLLEAPARIHGHDLRPTACIGIATSARSHARAEDVLRDAGAAMHRAKSSGRERVLVFVDDTRAGAARLPALEVDLRAAIDAEALDVHYQPIVDLVTGEIVAFEALSRWKHPVLGPIPPAEYIPLAEKTGLVVPLGEQVLRASLARLARWSRELPTGRVPSLSVNVSPVQLAEPGFADRLHAVVRESGVDPSKVDLEIAERAATEGAGQTLKVIERCRALGIGVHMDEFGVGRASLAHLQHYPLTGLKLDRSFTGGGRADPRCMAMVQAILTIARNMRIPAIAKGVETVEDVAWLQTLGCERGQGFFFATAVAADEAFEMLRQASTWALFDGVRPLLDARAPRAEPPDA